MFNKNLITYDSSGNRYKTLSLDEYLEIIKPNLRNAIHKFEGSGERKSQLSIKILFRPPKDTDGNPDIYGVIIRKLRLV